MGDRSDREVFAVQVILMPAKLAGGYKDVVYEAAWATHI